MGNVTWIRREGRVYIDGIKWENLELLVFNQNTCGCERPKEKQIIKEHTHICASIFERKFRQM